MLQLLQVDPSIHRFSVPGAPSVHRFSIREAWMDLPSFTPKSRPAQKKKEPTNRSALAAPWGFEGNQSRRTAFPAVALPFHPVLSPVAGRGVPRAPRRHHATHGPHPRGGASGRRSDDRGSERSRRRSEQAEEKDRGLYRSPPATRKVSKSLQVLRPVYRRALK